MLTSAGADHCGSGPDELADLREQLLLIRQDRRVWRIAVRWAGAADLADDALQAAYCQVVAVKNPGRIANLRAYYLRVVKNEVANQRSLRRAVPPSVEEMTDLDQRERAVYLLAPSPPVDEAVWHLLRGQGWLDRLAGDRQFLLARIPSRSAVPARYRAVVYAAAGQLLRDTLNNEPSEADSTQALRAAYPGYFAQPGADPNLLYQRCRRARQDMKTLLRNIVHRDET